MANIVLTKESSEKEIKAYFAAVLKLTESQNEFPVNLDEVWPLVYPRKDHAVRALKENFILGIDYQALPKNGEQDSAKGTDYQILRKNPQNRKSVDYQVLRGNAENLKGVDFKTLAQNGKQDAGNNWGGNNKIDYYLTVPCMEFFIARKVRPVFEVYRQVFHTTAKNVAAAVPAPKLSEKLQVATWLIKTLNLNEASKLQLAKAIAEPIGLPTPDYTPSKGILKSATELLKERGMDLTARDFNLQAMLKGYLCEQTRKSSNGGAKTFKAITEKGRPYGENQVSPKNPRETQPLWYADKFGELLKELDIDLKKEG